MTSANDLRTLYPSLEPYATEMLDVGDGQCLYVEQCGNPHGRPAVFLHGGPGGGCVPDHRRLFDPERYRIVLFDQRGAGRSTPQAGRDFADLSANTTWHLVADIERIREHLGIEAWQVFGGSWGSTLALAYAQAHPGRVTELVLRGIFTLRASELDWFYQDGPRGAGAAYPDYWEDYVAPIAPQQRGRMIEAYWAVLNGPDEEARLRAARAWCQWESRTTHLLLDPAAEEEPTPESLLDDLSFARIENHYFMNHGWLREGQLIADAGERLSGIPAVIVQGRYDMCCPATTAWDLHRAWPAARLQLIADAGHSVSEPGITDALVRATDGFAG
jgi:proline iminopeptidase